MDFPESREIITFSFRKFQEPYCLNLSQIREIYHPQLRTHLKRVWQQYAPRVMRFYQLDSVDELGLALDLWPLALRLFSEISEYRTGELAGFVIC